MPSHSAYLQSNVRSGERARARRPLAAAVFMSVLSALCSVGCRDMREDANYCSSCASGEPSDGTMTEPQSTDPGSEVMGSSAPSSSSGGHTAGSMTSTSNQAGTGNGSQAASPAAPSGGASAASGSSGVPTAGTRGPQAGAAARGGNAGPSSSERDAGNADPGSSMRDAGSQEPTEPEPTPDAGAMTPPLPCNGQCPNDRPVCDETKAVPQCVQCTAQEQFACVGATSTCDVEQQKCVQCTPDDARHCDDATPTCNQDNRCVACRLDVPTSCPSAQQICDNEQRCVECLPGRTEYCPDNRTMCNADGQCVECMNDAQCQNPGKPRCDSATNSCVGCERAEDCGRFPDAPVCDEESKQCVACSPTGALCPAGSFCARDIYQCLPGTPKRRGCEPCATDSDCAESPSVAACIEQDNDSFCFTAAIPAAPLCEQGYTAMSVRGRGDIMYCMPVASCPAISNALNNKSCTSSNDCGRGGQCPMAPANTCKLSCSDSQPCPAPFYCDQSNPMNKVCKQR